MTDAKRGRPKGAVSQLPDLRAITLKALMRAGGVDYLTRQATENPMGFMSLLGRVMPRESHVELTGELRIRQEVRRDLVEKLVVLMRAEPAPLPTENRTEGTTRALPALTHAPDTMLKAAVLQDREGLSRRAENARREGAGVLAGVVQRAANMHIEASEAPRGVRSMGQDRGTRDPGVSIENPGVQDSARAVRSQGRPYVCAPAADEDEPAPI